VRSKQKKYKFSKGEINPKLLERQDLEVLESSASYINNMVSTPFGSVRTRGGTENIAQVADNITIIATPTITNGISGTTANLYNETALFISGGISGITEWFKYDFGAVGSIYKVYTENMYFSLTEAKLTPVIVDGVITGATINTEGIGLNDVILTVTDRLGEDAELTATTDSAGAITGVTVVDGGTDYSSTTSITIDYTSPSETIKLQASIDDATWVDIDSYDVTSITNDFVSTIDSSIYRYVRFLSDGTVKSRLNLYYSRAFTSTPEADSIKMMSFVFNLSQKYLMVLKDEEIEVFEDDVLIETVTATGLVDSLFENIKATQAEDTMIFTHPDLRTKQLVRSQPAGVLTWTFEDFPWINVPMDAFGSEVTTQPAQTLTPNATEGSIKLTAGGAVFTSASIGQLIDGNGGRVRITEYESTTIVYGYTTIPFYTTAAIASGDWDYIAGYVDVWSATKGYPVTCLFYEQRLWFGGAKSKPNTVWASRVGQIDDFENVANYANDSISATISSEQIDEIVNIYANRGIQVFTAGAEWIIPEGATTPDTINVSKNTSNGSLAKVEPTDISGVTMFVEKNGKSLLSFVYSDTQAAYTTESISLLTDLMENPVRMAIDYNSSQDVGNFLYVAMEDGSMAVWCIMLSQKIVSPVRFNIGNGGLIKDVVNVAGDTYLLVDRKDKIYLEKLTNGKLDSETTDSSLAANITGLGDYNGEYVRVYNDTDGDLGTHYVLNDEITLDSAPTAEVNIGYQFAYALTSNKISINGQTENIEKRIAKATVVTADTASLTFENQVMSQTDDVYDFYGVTAFSRDCRFHIIGTWDYTEILSILLNINYGEK